MRLTPVVLITAVLLGTGLAGPAGAQIAPGPPPVEPSARAPMPQQGDRARNLEFLLGALKVAPDETSAKAIEDRIWALWQASGSDTVDLLMTRVKQASDAGNYDLALRLLDSIIEIRPQFVEAWNRRATIFF